jgi:pyruvate dehydrogenase E2 component (dihydrolipoamide acetyltransferase)
MSRDTALFEFRFPDIGEGLTEGTIVELKVAPGGKVKQGDALAIVETDKVVTEMPSPVDGVVVELPIVKGQVVRVGEIVARIRTTGAAGGPSGGKAAPAVASDPTFAESGTVVGRLETGSGGIMPASGEGRAVPPRSGGNGAGSRPTGKKVHASPVARKLAADAGIDLASVAGTGPGGRLLKKDLEVRAPAPPSAPHGPGMTKLSTMRLAIAAAMEKSQAIPAAAVHDFTVVDELLQVRRDMNETAQEKVGLLAFFVKAAAHALQ